MVERVIVTDKAKNLIDRLIAQHGALMFHLSGGCCDGSSPMCFQNGEFRVGDSDILLGKINECDFYMAKDQYAFFKNSQLIVDVVEGRGASFSLEIPLGVRFVIQSRLFSDMEIEPLG